MLKSAHLPDSTFDKTNDSAHKSNIILNVNHPDSLMCAIPNQCRSQLNVTTTANELRETIINEMSCNSDVYCEHFNVEKSVLDELCANHLENESSLHVDSAISTIFQCQVYKLKTVYQTQLSKECLLHYQK